MSDYENEESLEEADRMDSVSLHSGSGPPVTTGSVKNFGGFQGGSSMCSSRSFDDGEDLDSDLDISDPFPDGDDLSGPVDRVPSCLASDFGDDGSIGPWSGFVPRVHGAQLSSGVGLCENNCQEALQTPQEDNQPAPFVLSRHVSGKFDFKDCGEARDHLRRLLSKHRARRV